MESEGPAEKYRAVIDGGNPVMNRSAHWWGKVEPVIRGRRRSHSPTHYGFEFLGYKIKRGRTKLRLPESKIRSGLRAGALYAYPRAKSIRRFMDQVRQRTKRTLPLTTPELIAKLNPLLRGWGEYYKAAHVRTLFHRLDRWIVRRLRSHRFKRWRNNGDRQLPESLLYAEYGLVNLVRLIPSLASRQL